MMIFFPLEALEKQKQKQKNSNNKKEVAKKVLIPH